MLIDVLCDVVPNLAPLAWGGAFGGVFRYLLSKAGAQRLLTATADGLSTPLDGKIWYSSTVYVTRTDYIWHPPCANPCPSSVRTWLNKELDPSTEYPD